MYGFIKGRVSTVEDLGQLTTAEWIAHKVAKWHQVHLPSTKDKQAPKEKLWATMWSWLKEGIDIRRGI